MKTLILISLSVALLSCNTGVFDNGKNNKGITGHSTRKKALNRSRYYIEYYSDWRLDTASKLYDADSHFTLYPQPVENGMFTIFVFAEPRDEEKELQRHLAAQQEKSIKHGAVTYFTQWGAYQGHGASIKGRLRDVWESEIKIFVYSTAEKSFLITSLCTDSYKDDVLPGLELIESSFRIK